MSSPRSSSLRLGVYLLGLVLVAGAFELVCRHWQPLLRASSHRSLFKAALLEQRLPQDVVFFGTSRAGEALHPNSFVAELNARGAPALSAFNVSTPYSSLEILSFVTKRFASAPGLKVAIIEVSMQQLHRKPLPWVSEAASADDFDGRTFAFLEDHSTFVAERKSFVLNSLGRLSVAALFGSRMDGTEEMGTDYVKSVLGRRQDALPSEFDIDADCRPHPVEAEPSSLAQWTEERDMYVALEKEFANRGVQVAFFIPPTRDPAASEEATPEFRAFTAALHAATSRPVWDFSDCKLPAKYFRDPTHLSHLGGSHFTRFIAREAAESPEFAKALSLHALP